MVWFTPCMRTSAWTGLSVTLFCFTWLAPMCFSFVTCFPELLPLLFLCLQLWLLIFTSRVTEAIFDANSSALTGKKIPKNAENLQLALSLHKKCEDRLPVNSARWSRCCSGRGLRCWFCMRLNSQCILTSCWITPFAAWSGHWPHHTAWGEQRDRET